MADDMSVDEQIRLIFKQAGVDVVKDAAESFEVLTQREKDAAKAADQVTTATKSVDAAHKPAKITLDELAGKGDGEAGSGGFAGAAGGALRLERALNAMVSGHGLARAGPMLEGLITTMGGPGGLGMAVIALELGLRVLVPTLEKLGGAISDEHIVKLNNFTTSLAKLREEGEKVSSPTGHPDMDRKVKEYLEQGAGATLSTLLQTELYKRLVQANTLTDAQKLAGMAPKPDAELREGAKRQADLLMGLIEHREAGAIGRAQQLLKGDVAGTQLMQEMARRIEEGRLAEEAKRAKENFVGPPAPSPEEIRHRDEAEARKAKQQTNLDNRANDPTRQLREMEARDAAAINAQIADQWNAGGRVETPEQLGMISQHAHQNRQLGYDLATAVQMAVYQTQEQIMRSFWERMNSGNRSNQFNGSPW